MSEDELYQKQSQIAARLAFAARHSGSMEMVSQLQNLSMAISDEIQERAKIQAFNDRQAMFPEIIETEPDLKPEKATAAPKSPRVPPRIMPGRKTGQIGGIAAHRSASPTYDEPDGSNKDKPKE